MYIYFGLSNKQKDPAILRGVAFFYNNRRITIRGRRIFSGIPK